MLAVQDLFLGQAVVAVLPERWWMELVLAAAVVVAVVLLAVCTELV